MVRLKLYVTNCQQKCTTAGIKHYLQCQAIPNEQLKESFLKQYGDEGKQQPLELSRAT